MVLTFIAQLIILFFTLLSSYHKNNYWFGILSLIFSTAASLFLLAALLFYNARFDVYYARRFVTQNPVITRGYSFWFTVADLIFMLIGIFVGIFAF
jgi:hypothetical protein